MVLKENIINTPQQEHTKATEDEVRHFAEIILAETFSFGDIVAKVFAKHTMLQASTLVMKLIIDMMLKLRYMAKNQIPVDMNWKTQLDFGDIFVIYSVIEKKYKNKSFQTVQIMTINLKIECLCLQSAIDDNDSVIVKGFT